MKEPETEHHLFLTALSFDKDDQEKRIPIKIEKTDKDELCITIEEKNYYFSLSQLLLNLKYSNSITLGIYL